MGAATISCFVPQWGYGNNTFLSPLIKSLHVQPSSKKLILLRLNGGNDGLNTLVPLDSYANLTRHRKDIILPSSSLHTLGDVNIGLHPRMTDIHRLYKEGNIAFAHGVSIQNASRSHFKATEDVVMPNGDRGWLFDYLQQNINSENYIDPVAIAVGPIVSMTCNGEGINYSYPTRLSKTKAEEIVGELNPLDGSHYSDLLRHVATTGDQINRYEKRINAVLDAGYARAELYNLQDSLSRSLHDVARAITGGIQTNVFIINIGGFDTHGNQVNSSDATLGGHANLWGRINDAIASFVQDMKTQFLPEGGSYFDNILGMTFSEFGRRIAQNGSFGTDHGTAGPTMFFGSCFENQIIGDAPIIDQNVDSRDGVPMEIDIRDIYATILSDHLGLGRESVQSSFARDGHQVHYYDLFSSCSKETEKEQEEEQEVLPPVVSGGLRIYPNPVTTQVHITGLFAIEEIDISLSDLNGKIFFHQIRQNINPNKEYTISLGVSNLRLGVYMLRVSSQHSGIKETIKIVKK